MVQRGMRGVSISPQFMARRSYPKVWPSPKD